MEHFFKGLKIIFFAVFSILFNLYSYGQQVDVLGVSPKPLTSSTGYQEWSESFIPSNNGLFYYYEDRLQRKGGVYKLTQDTFAPFYTYDLDGREKSGYSFSVLNIRNDSLLVIETPINFDTKKPHRISYIKENNVKPITSFDIDEGEGIRKVEYRKDSVLITFGFYNTLTKEYGVTRQRLFHNDSWSSLEVSDTLQFFPIADPNYGKKKTYHDTTFTVIQGSQNGLENLVIQYKNETNTLIPQTFYDSLLSEYEEVLVNIYFRDNFFIIEESLVHSEPRFEIKRTALRYSLDTILVDDSTTDPNQVYGTIIEDNGFWKYDNDLWSDLRKRHHYLYFYDGKRWMQASNLPVRYLYKQGEYFYVTGFKGPDFYIGRLDAIYDPTTLTIDNIIPSSKLYTIYPNPVEKEFIISNESSSANIFHIYNQFGQLIQTEEVLPFTTKIVNLFEQAPGIYFVKGPSGNTTKILKL